MSARFDKSSMSVITTALGSGQLGCESLIQETLDDIHAQNGDLKAFTLICSERAIKTARRIDQKVARGETLGKLAGVPFAVKNLFDIKDEVTLAGSKINKGHAPATKDAVLIERLEAEDAVLVGALAMGEYAYDFTGENAHYGNCANPFDHTRMSGGSSSGSGSAVGAKLVPLSLGSDTNGSIRVPSSFCGIFGLKPTYGRLPRTHSFPFCDSLDHLGPLARTASDLATAFDLLQGFDEGDHACVNKDVLPTQSSLNQGIGGLKIMRLSGYFNCDEFTQARKAVDKICKALEVNEQTQLRGAKEGRSAAYLITNIESSRLHLQRLKTRAHDFDPDTRDRFLAGAMLPASWYIRALQVRQWYKEQALAQFKHCDLLVAPATPCVAPKIGQKILSIGGVDQPLRPNLGYFTQPISAIGLPSVVVPTIDDDTGLPIGVQLIAAPWREDLCLRAAKFLEDAGFTAA